MRAHAIAGIVLTLWGATAFAQPPAFATNSSSSWPASPSVLATVLAANDRITLVVLWRGEPRWYMGGGRNSGNSSQSSGLTTMSASFGGTATRVAYDPVRRVATIESTTVRLGAEEDVILVDEADRTSGAKVMGAAKANVGALRRGEDLATALQSAPDVLAFMQCDPPGRGSTSAGRGCGSIPTTAVLGALPDVSGRWRVELNPDFSGNPDTLECTFVQDGAKLAITCGDQKMAGEITPSAITWSFTTGLDNSIAATFIGFVARNGQTMSGTWRLATRPSRSGRFSATKVP